MALFKSALVTQASGSVGGLTFAHAAGGLYMRSRAIPVNTNTSQQSIVRGAMTTLIDRWSTVLTDAQRAGWNLFAANTPVTNALGTTFFQSGQNAYVQANTARVAAGNTFYTPLDGLPLVAGTAAPSDFAPDEFAYLDPGDVSIANADGLVQTFDVEFDNTREWATAVGGALLIYIGRPQNNSRNFFRGPWRLAGAILGSVLAPTSPATLTAINTVSYGIGVGQKLFAAAVAIRPIATAGGAGNMPIVSSRITTNTTIVA